MIIPFGPNVTRAWLSRAQSEEADAVGQWGKRTPGTGRRAMVMAGALGCLLVPSACGSSAASSSNPLSPPTTGGGRSGPTTTVVRLPVPGPNLIHNPDFTAPGDVNGVAAGLTAWGASSVSLNGDAAVPGTEAEQLTLPAGSTGGVFEQLPASAGAAYTQSAYLDVESLAPAATATMILEWYDRNLRLLGYQMHPINVLDTGYARRAQSARSPQGTAEVRFVVNIAGGGRLLFDAPKLERGIGVSPFVAGPTGPAPPATGGA